MAIDAKLTGIYLNDHLAGATVGRELARRCHGSNRGTEFGRPLETLAAEIDEDRETLRAIIAALGLREDRVKQAGALIAERAGRLKLNGSIRGYSPLSRLVELEGLSLGVEGKRALWTVLRGLGDSRLAAFDLAALGERADRQRDTLEGLRRDAARIALSPQMSDS